MHAARRSVKRFLILFRRHRVRAPRAFDGRKRRLFAESTSGVGRCERKIHKLSRSGKRCETRSQSVALRRIAVKDQIRSLAERYAAELKRSVDHRVAEMEWDDRAHVLIYRVLGMSETEGKLIDG